MPITQRGSAVGNNSGTGNATSLPLAWPTGTDANDLVVACGNIAAGTSISMGQTGPTGLTKVDGQQGTASNSKLGVWEGLLSSADLLTTLAITSSTGRNLTDAAIVFSGAAYEQIVQGVQVSGTTGATIPAFTPTHDNDLAVLCLGIADNTSNQNYVVTPPTGWTQQISAQDTFNGVRIGSDILTKPLGAGTKNVAQAAQAINASGSPNLRWLLSVTVLRPVAQVHRYDGSRWVPQRVDRYSGSAWVAQVLDSV